MNIQIRVQVPADTDKSWAQDTDVQLITDPTTVRAVLATIIACEAAIAADIDLTVLPDPDVADFVAKNPDPLD
jgi:hypothetical protein